MKTLFRACVALSALAALPLSAGEWKGLEESNWRAGRKLRPNDLRRKVVTVVEWGVGCPDCPDVLGFVQKNVIGQRVNGHPVAMLASHLQEEDPEKVKAAAAARGIKCAVYQDARFSDVKAAPGVPYVYVVDTTSTVVYEGTDKNDAVVAMVDAITELPVPGQLINGVDLKKFKAFQKKLVMGFKAEGAALAPFKAALKSKKPGEAEEAQAVLESIEKAKKNLEDEIAEDLAAEDKGAALRDIRWFSKTWPSEASKYADKFRELAADPEAKAGEAALLKALKRRR